MGQVAAAGHVAAEAGIDQHLTQNARRPVTPQDMGGGGGQIAPDTVTHQENRSRSAKMPGNGKCILQSGGVEVFG